jgi:hypothetical protein
LCKTNRLATTLPLETHALTPPPPSPSKENYQKITITT